MSWRISGQAVREQQRELPGGELQRSRRADVLTVFGVFAAQADLGVGPQPERREVEHGGARLTLPEQYRLCIPPLLRVKIICLLRRRKCLPVARLVARHERARLQRLARPRASETASDWSEE